MLVSLFGRIKSHSSTSDASDNNTDTFDSTQREEEQDNSDVPIDSSTIEYVEFEEIKDNENNITQ